MKRKTSISVDPDVWEDFKQVATAHKRSSASELELLMEEAIAAHRQKRGLLAPTVLSSSRSTGSTPPSGAKRAR